MRGGCEEQKVWEGVEESEAHLEAMTKRKKMKVNGVHFVFVPKHSRDRTLFAIK